MDPKKAEANQTKHDVSFEEASTVFTDPLARIFPDEEHSADELREIIIGHSVILANFTATYARVGFSAHARRRAGAQRL